MRSKITITVVVIMILAFLVSTGISAEKKTLNIVFTVKNSVNPFLRAAYIGGTKAVAEYKDIVNINFMYSSPTKSDNIAEQTSQMEDIIVKHPDAIVFIPVDYVALVPTVEKMNKAGIVVTNYCNELKAGGKYLTYAGSDDEKLYYELTKFMFKQVGNKGKVIHQEGVPGAITAQDRKRGFMKALNETPGMELLTIQPGNYNRLISMQVMENLLQRYPKIDNVVAGNDEQALGCVEAIDAVGRLKEIKVAGVDGNANAAASILQGRLFATVDYSGHDQGYLATKAAIKHLLGEKVPHKIFLPITIVTQEIAQKWTLTAEERPVPNWDKMVKDAIW